MFAEEQFGVRDRATDIALANVVQVNTASFDVLSRLPLGRTKAGVNEDFQQRRAGPVQSGLLDFFRRHFSDDFVERAFGDAVESAAKQNLARANGFGGGAGAVDEIGDG